MKKLVLVKTASFCPLNDKNGVVLALPYFFLNFRLYQNDVILDKTEPKRRRFGVAFKYLKRRHFGYLTPASKRHCFGAVLGKTTSFCLWKKRNDVVSYGRLLQNRRASVLPFHFFSSFGGRGMREKKGPPVGGLSCAGDLTVYGG